MHVSGWGESRVARWPPDGDGWMVANGSFTLLSQRLGYSSVCVAVVIRLVWCTLQMLPTDGLFQDTPPPCLWGHLLTSPKNCPSRWEPPQHTNVHLSTRPTAVVDSRVLHQGKGCFSESSGGKVSAEMWSHADCAHHKWFLSAGGNLLAPSPAVFSHKMPLKRLLSVIVILAGTFTHGKLPSHFASLCFSPATKKRKLENRDDLSLTISLDVSLCKVCRVWLLRLIRRDTCGKRSQSMWQKKVSSPQVRPKCGFHSACQLYKYCNGLGNTVSKERGKEIPSGAVQSICRSTGAETKKKNIKSEIKPPT